MSISYIISKEDNDGRVSYFCYFGWGMSPNFSSNISNAKFFKDKSSANASLAMLKQKGVVGYSVKKY